MIQREHRALSSRWWKVTPLIAVIVGVGCNTKGDQNDIEEVPDQPAPAPPPGPQPSFGTTTSLAKSPPAISGGTMAVAPDGHTVIASDSDRDRIYVVDIPSRTVKFSIPLVEGSEPGRVAVDASGHAYVSLRGSGNIATVDLAAGTASEVHVCAAPRGLAYDAEANMLHVACLDGFLASIPLAGGPVRHIALDRDLRDVVLTKNNILVSRFRQGDVIKLSRDGEYIGKTDTRGGNLAWRMVRPPTTPAPDADASTSDTGANGDEPVIVSQDPTDPSLSQGDVGAYGSAAAFVNDACGATTVTPTRLDIPGRGKVLVPPAVLPVDLATNGREYAIVAAGNGHTPALPQIFVYRPQAPSSASQSGADSFGDEVPTNNAECVAMAKGFLPGQAIAVVYDGDDQLIVQSREPAKLFIMSPDRQRVAKEIVLSGESREDTGHAIFHSNSGGFIACASCHAEGGDDGRVWALTEGSRRTPSMRGTIKNTAPYHWDGTMKNMGDIVDHVFVTRMSGPKLESPKVATLQTWLEAIPAPPKLAVQDPPAVARGQDLFMQHGCPTCHAGASLTNNRNQDVGTGAAFQVPALVGVAWRAPYLHSGCAKTLKDRFDVSCGGSQHGDTADLTPAQIGDLTTFLETL